MTKLWHRLLCRIGKHEWYGVQFVWGGYDECWRCGQQESRLFLPTGSTPAGGTSQPRDKKYRS